MSRSCETGVLETNENKYVVDKKDLVDLKKILDKFRIHYVLDRVSFHSTESSVALAKAVHEKDVWKVEKDGSVHLDNQFGHGREFRYQCLTIPGWDLVRRTLENYESLSPRERLFIRKFI